MMGTLEHIDLLSLIVALSAYVGGVRLAILGRITANPAPANREALKTYLKWLTPADIALVSAALVLFLKIFWPYLCNTPTPTWFDSFFVWAFFIGVVVLLIHHVVLSIKTFRT